MKKSRAGLALLVIILLVAGFALLVAVLSVIGGDGDGSGLSGLLASRNKIGIVPIDGTITESEDTLKLMRKYRKNKTIRAVILRINSPGGAVAPAQEIYREIERLKEKKPVVASIETIGASAAYYIASNTSRVVCSKGTITGSIGVIMILADMHEVLDWAGVKVNIIKAGKFKDIGSGVRPLTDKEREILESFAEEIHEQFIKDVAKGREGKIDIEKVREIADGSFFTGSKAKELGLVDEIGNFYDAVKIAAKLGNIDGEPKLEFPEEKWDSYLDVFMESASRSIGKALYKAGAFHAVPIVQ
jgi:protease-4